MPKQPKLTDLQLILLSSASARTDGGIFPIPASLKADDPRLDKSLRASSARSWLPRWMRPSQPRSGVSMTTAALV